MTETPETTERTGPRITVIGIGGAGGNAVNNMIESHLEGIEFVVANTDAQALGQSVCERRIQMGRQITQGLGAGSRPDIGRAAAEETLEEILGELDGANMAFITAGMGGGTGTGAAPVIARAAREAGILTVGVVSKPFQFEGVHRMRLAEAGIEELTQFVDTLIVIPNQNLFRVANEKTTFAEAFKLADEVLRSGVRGVTDLMVMPGLINLDFADIRSVMSEMGKAMMGTGEAEGEGRALASAEAAISNPLLDEVSMKGARGVLINITGGMDMTLFEVDEAANRIRDEVDADANIIFGSTFDQQLDGLIRVSVIATGIEVEARPDEAKPAKPVKSPANRMIVSLYGESSDAKRADQDPPSPEPKDDPPATSGETAEADPDGGKPEETMQIFPLRPRSTDTAAKGEAGSAPAADTARVPTQSSPASGDTGGGPVAATIERLPSARRSGEAGALAKKPDEPDKAEVITQPELLPEEPEPTPRAEIAETPGPSIKALLDAAPVDTDVPGRRDRGKVKTVAAVVDPEPEATAATADPEPDADAEAAQGTAANGAEAPADGQPDLILRSEAKPAVEAKAGGATSDPKPESAAATKARKQAKPDRPPVARSKKGGFLSWLSGGGGSASANELFEKGDRYYYGHGARKDLSVAFRSYMKAAEMGHAAAQNRVGWMYEKGEGTEADHAAAVSWYRKAADQGNVNAMNDLGYMFRQGWGVGQSYDEALGWFHKAAEQYDSYAEYNLGQMYENGWGVDKDLDEAIMWFRRSAARGHEWAAKRLEDLGVKT